MSLGGGAKARCVVSPAKSAGLPAIAAVPACNEAAWIERCLLALGRQQNGSLDRIVVLVNNSSDATASLARAVQPALDCPVDVIEHCFAPEQKSAGFARRFAMQCAADWVPADGVLLCTDADSQVAQDWLSNNLFHVRQGADAVAGRAIIDPVDAAAIPVSLHEDDARECAYTALLNEIDSVIDPEPADPWPRHSEHSGASICVTTSAYRRAGGIPALPVGEDRGFFQALRRIDASIRHAMDVTVTVSGRIQGRATGGMADTIRRRMIAPDPFLDDALEPAANRAQRARLRARARRLHRNGGIVAGLAGPLGMSVAALERALGHDAFGFAWEQIEAQAGRLRRVLVPSSAVRHETARARAILAALRERSERQLRLPAALTSAPVLMPAADTSRMAG